MKDSKGFYNRMLLNGLIQSNARKTKAIRIERPEILLCTWATRPSRVQSTEKQAQCVVFFKREFSIRASRNYFVVLVVVVVLVLGVSLLNGAS